MQTGNINKRKPLKSSKSKKKIKRFKIIRGKNIFVVVTKPFHKSNWFNACTNEDIEIFNRLPYLNLLLFVRLIIWMLSRLQKLQRGGTDFYANWKYKYFFFTLSNHKPKRYRKNDTELANTQSHHWRTKKHYFVKKQLFLNNTLVYQ